MSLTATWSSSYNSSSKARISAAVCTEMISSSVLKQNDRKESEKKAGEINQERMAENHLREGKQNETSKIWKSTRTQKEIKKWNNARIRRMKEIRILRRCDKKECQSGVSSKAKFRTTRLTQKLHDEMNAKSAKMKQLAKFHAKQQTFQWNVRRSRTKTNFPERN